MNLKKGKIYFEIKSSDLLISNNFNLETSKERLKELSYSVFQVKDFYENKFSKKLDLKFSNYNMNLDNSVYHNLMNEFFVKNAINIEGSEINKEFDLQTFKKEIKLYLNNEQNLGDLIVKFNLDEDIKKLVACNEEKFKNFLNKTLKIDKYDDFTKNFSKDEIEYNLSNNKLEKLIKNNKVVEKMKDIIKRKDNIDIDDR